MDAQSKTKPHRILLKKYAIPPKYCTQKTATAIATNMEKKYFVVLKVGGIRKLKVKEFCVFDHIELLFNSLFLNNYFKNIFRRK